MKIQLFIKFAAIVGSFVSTLSACNSASKASLIEATPQKTASAIQATASPQSRRITKDEGWEIPGLAHSKEIKARSAFKGSGNESTQVYWTWFEPEATNGEEFIIEDGYFSANERKTLNLLSGTLAVVKITRYDVKGKAFCYLVTTHPKDVGAMSGLFYYDEDGDSMFETVEQGSPLLSFIPRLPQWAQQREPPKQKLREP